MTFPDIPLDAVNKAASLLFSRKDSATQDEALGLKGNLVEKIGEIDRAISSIHEQLAKRTDDPDWEKSARRALRRYHAQKESVLKFLSSANAILNGIDAHNARVARTERHIGQIRVGHAKKMERVAAANNDVQLWSTEFKQVCKEALGEARYMELVKETNRRLAAKTPTTPDS